MRLKRPDAAIVDIRMPPTHTDEGLVAAQRIRAEHPDVGVLVLSQYVEPSYAMRLLEEHPERVGYLLKERVFDVGVLVDALRRIDDGETVVDPTIVSRLVRPAPPATTRSPSSPTASARCSASSPRACRTARSPHGSFVTERTVEAHVKQIFLKLGLELNPELAPSRARRARLRARRRRAS